MSDNQLITKSNQLIQETINNMSVKEVKLMAVLLAEYRSAWDKDNLCTQTILNRREFLNYLDVNTGGTNYEYLNSVLDKFAMKAYCQWQDPTTKRSNITFYFKNISYNTTNNGNTDIVFTWNEEMTPFIVGLDKNFTKIFKHNILSLQSKKSITLYELLKSYAGRKYPPTITIDELKEKLDMQSPAYNVFKDFYKRGIEEPLKEINENTDISVSVVKNKDKSDKRKIVSLTFKIKNQAEKKVWWEYDFPKVKLTEEEFSEVKNWIYPVHHKELLAELEKKIDEIGNVKGGHYKWLKSRYENKMNKYKEEQTKNEDTSDDNYYRSLFCNPYMNK
jgi:plasmid replication initiation protein